MKRAFVSLALIISFLLPQPASAAVTVTEIDSARYPIALAVDNDDNVFIGDADNVDPALQGLVVIPASTGTLFGQSVTAGTRKLLVATAGASYPVFGVAVTSSGIVVYETQDGDIYALSNTTASLFGVSISPNTATLIIPDTPLKGAIVFDSTGNLFGIEIATGDLFVIPVNSGTLYGIPVIANQPTTLYSSGSRWFWDLALDSSGNIFISDGWSGSPGVYVLPKNTSTLYGQSFTANTFAKVAAFGESQYAGIHIDSTDTIFANEYGNSTYVLSSTNKNIFETTVNANSATSIVSTWGYVDQGVTLTSGGDLILGGPSSTWRVTAVAPATAPAAPTLNSVTGGNKQLTIAFTSGADGGAAITDYEYSLNSGSYISAGTTTSPFTITGLSGRTAYSVTIKARNSVELSSASSSLSATTTDTSLDASETAAAEAARVAAASMAADAAKKQKELTEILSLIPSIAGLTLNLGDLTNSLLTTKCVKGKTIKYVKKSAKCPKGYVKKK